MSIHKLIVRTLRVIDRFQNLYGSTIWMRAIHSLCFRYIALIDSELFCSWKLNQFHYLCNSNQWKNINLFNFMEHNKLKTIKAIDLKARLKISHIRIAVPNKFWDWSTTRSECPFSSDERKKLTFFGNVLGWNWPCMSWRKLTH